MNEGDEIVLVYQIDGTEIPCFYRSGDNPVFYVSTKPDGGKTPISSDWAKVRLPGSDKVVDIRELL